jgi:hypothetical protein
MADVSDNALAFLADEYIAADGPAIYNAAFGLTVPCYVIGTKILTVRGYVPIEDLTEDDKIVSKGTIRNEKFRAQFRFAPIVWKGHFFTHGLDKDSAPILIKKDAFGKNKPFEDLYVSPGHNIQVRDRMVPACKLINGNTVIRQECDEVTYYHIELDKHSVISANGLSAESYLDVDNRNTFKTSDKIDRTAYW